MTASEIVVPITQAPPYRVHEGKTAVITGGARSIGASIAQNLASKGANVVLVYLTEASDEPAAALAAKLAEVHKVKAVPVRADFTTAEGCAKIVETVKTSLPPNTKRGGPQVDILINCAALFHAVPLEAVTVEDFHKVYSVNVLGPILLTQAVRPLLPDDRSGRIVNISSVGSKVGLEYLTLYGGSKGALEAMTRTWARELKEHCTVNACNPSSTMTDMLRGAPDAAKQAISMWYPLTPLSGIRDWDSDEQKEMAEKYGGRAGYAEEIAGIVGMICSPESGWMTGCLVSANGGQWMAS
ncbi:short-chain dehydrogenase [Plectosphaerella cucumerina]|uniref:Short-chain dehydrogenase n=1 Tax=Plectosphaerella cucumerina TaxID=40658 RepID=A0A8K0TKQ9_9PEZI|nr:short-chain dehydrogenase [Plectosphaerella cucumerina]